MKKTFILLAALSAAFTAQAADITLTPAAGTLTTESAAATFTATDYTNSFYTVDVNVGEGGTWTWTSDTFTLAEDVTLDSIQAVLLTFNGNGQRQYSNRAGYYTFSIQDANGSEVYTSGQTGVTFTGAGNSNASASTATETDRGNSSGAVITSIPTAATKLTAGDYTLSLSVAENNAQGYFVGISSIGVNTNVPEPTTATLSLLALAGLAARRRRK